jgi:hypothetical protein
MQTQKKTSPFKDIKSFFSPNNAAAAAGAPKPGAAKLKTIASSETAMPNKLDFAATAHVAGAKVEQSSSDSAAGVNPREALATVMNGVVGAASAVANRRHSDLTAPTEGDAHDGNSPAPSVGFTTPAQGLRAAHTAVDPSDTPLANAADAVRATLEPRYLQNRHPWRVLQSWKSRTVGVPRKTHETSRDYARERFLGRAKPKSFANFLNERNLRNARTN